MNSGDSICASCSVGCNTRVDSDRQNRIKRVKPRRNDAVNKEWMCDHGRLDFEYVYADDRLNLCRQREVRGDKWRDLPERQLGWRDLPWNEAYKVIAERIFVQDTVYLVSFWNTTELFERLADEISSVPSARLAGFGRPATDDQVFPGFTIHGDKNPNRAGFEEIFGKQALNLAGLIAGERIRNLVVISNVPDFAPDEELRAVLDHADCISVFDFYEGELARHPAVDLAIATLTHFEKSGSFVNRQGLRQRFKAAIEPVAFGRSTMEIIDRVKELRIGIRPRHTGAATPSQT
jgi:NADH-quinone oxidoreductase subunit G